MPDPPPLAALLAFAEPVPPSGPWANDLFPAVLLLALGAALVALGAWIVKPPPRPPHHDEHPGGHQRNRAPRRDRGGRFRGPPPNSGPANRTNPLPDPLRRPLRLP
ncbi:hypothetical protein [Alienimonas californiensis]|uniref:Uncharacterized protein n=1 Tax=Alienimonas californiensis TaxID=2527989 RepID=A0A517PBN5_9PLAN|nr:hypothetical protein [Alienimonas californiensis]QDT16780.1 hypothetical protein CA12_28870 [Alienimonas californiensis]